MIAEKPGLSAVRLKRYRERLNEALEDNPDEREFIAGLALARDLLEEEECRGLCWAPEGERRCRKPEGHDPGWHDDGVASWPDDTNVCEAKAAGVSCRLAAGHDGDHRGVMQGRMGDRVLPGTATWTDREGVPFLSIEIQVPSDLAGESLRGLTSESSGPGREEYRATRAALYPVPAAEEPSGPYCGAEKPSAMRAGYTYTCVRERGHEGPHNSGDGQWEDHQEEPPLPSCAVSWCSLPLGHAGAHNNVRGEDPA